MDNNQSRTFIFIVTKNCQFRCKYCYIWEKTAHERMPLSIGKKAVDFLLSCEDFLEESVVLDFIGGEPLLEISLIDEICDYFIRQAVARHHIWSKNYTIRITTNGLSYSQPEVQEFLKKHKNHLSISISLDGTRLKNDINRVFPSGEGTYDYIIDNVHLWINQFPESESRMTVSHADLPFIEESARHLIELGIKNIDIHIVNEDVWKPGDDIIYENQLIALADYVVNQGIEDVYFSCFHEEKGKPLSDDIEVSCGNHVIAIDGKGNLYPCHRFASYSLRSKKPLIIGTIDTGIDKNKLRPFNSFDSYTHNSQECNDCGICGDCRFCLAEDYDSADSQTIFQRSPAICRMHKAEVRAYNYYHRLHQLYN